MIVVTGTKRSGTSMWMQLLKAAGFPPIGDAFPRNWGKTIHDANPGGFWESELRRGINYQTNPDPKSGTYLFPDQTRRNAVKVFIPGLIRSDVAFIDRVVATVRPWRQYVRSLNRLYAMEGKALKAAAKDSSATPLPPVVMSPIVEWWVENFSLISDIVTRRYPFYMVAYDSVLQAPDATLRSVFEWLGEGDVEAAIKEVQPALRTQNEVSDDETSLDYLELEPGVIEVFDSLYELVREQRPLDQSFVDLLNQTNRALDDRIQAAVKEVTQGRAERKRLLEERRRGAEQAAKVDGHT
ncbi:MAG: hypothetical protein WBN70_09670 [Polyangiales bacterium]|jgi:hypothetical protein